MKNITFEEMLNMEVQDLLHGYPSGGFTYYYKDGDGGYHAGQEYGIMHNGDFPNRYNRIGQYAFTKQDKKLKKLTSCGWNMSVSGDDLILKINELVDAVNELTRDYENHLEGHRQNER